MSYESTHNNTGISKGVLWVPEWSKVEEVEPYVFYVLFNLIDLWWMQITFKTFAVWKQFYIMFTLNFNVKIGGSVKAKQCKK